MPNGVKPVDPLDSLPSVSAAYRGSGQPGPCKYWILDLGTHARQPHAQGCSCGKHVCSETEILCAGTHRSVFSARGPGNRLCVMSGEGSSGTRKRVAVTYAVDCVVVGHF